MNTWEHVRPYLHVIAANAERAKKCAALAAQYVRHLPSKPDFVTNAEAELKQAEEDIRLALACIKTARAAYQQLPVEDHRVLPQAAE